MAITDISYLPRDPWNPDVFENMTDDELYEALMGDYLKDIDPTFSGGDYDPWQPYVTPIDDKDVKPSSADAIDAVKELEDEEGTDDRRALGPDPSVFPPGVDPPPPGEVLDRGLVKWSEEWLARRQEELNEAKLTNQGPRRIETVKDAYGQPWWQKEDGSWEKIGTDPLMPGEMWELGQEQRDYEDEIREASYKQQEALQDNDLEAARWWQKRQMELQYEQMDFEGAQAGLGRDWQTEQSEALQRWQAEQSGLGRDWEAEQAGLSRDWQTGQSEYEWGMRKDLASSQADAEWRIASLQDQSRAADREAQMAMWKGDNEMERWWRGQSMDLQRQAQDMEAQQFEQSLAWQKERFGAESEQERWWREQQLGESAEDRRLEAARMASDPRNWIGTWGYYHGEGGLPGAAGPEEGGVLQAQQASTAPAPQFLAGVTSMEAGEPIRMEEITTPSTEYWGNMTPSERQGMLGYTGWTGIPDEDMLARIRKLAPPTGRGMSLSYG